MTKEISFARLSSLTRTWLEAGGQPTVELAAMEPTLWQDSGRSILDVIQLFAGAGYQVNLTTNGSTLTQYAAALAQSPVNKLRISWHSLDRKVYENITRGDYKTFLLGVQQAEKYGLPLCYNRILFHGLTDDIHQHLDIVDRQRSRIKFLELYITEQNKLHFGSYHTRIDEFLKIVESYPGIRREEDFTPGYATRSRYVWRTPNGGRVEFKVAETCKKLPVCTSCPYHKDCTEGFGEYFRVLPNGKAAFCYLRDDFDLPLFKGDAPDFPGLARQLEKTAGLEFATWVKKRSLRLILTTRCNYNCSLPQGEAIFCLGKRFRTL